MTAIFLYTLAICVLGFIFGVLAEKENKKPARNNHPFKNDAFADVMQAFKKLYPDKHCSVFWGEIAKDENGVQPYGYTDFDTDGNITVIVGIHTPVFAAVEILAHELAHVAAGKEEEHGAEWEKAFDAIFKEYNKIIESEAARNGKDT